MTTADKVLLAQTLVGLCTCGVILYSLKLTRKLQRQSEEQSRLQNERLELARQDLARAQERERRLSMPQIRWRGGASSATEENWDFENVGVDIVHTRWTVPEGMVFEHHPRNLIRSFDSGAVHFRSKEGKPLSYPLRFSLTFNTRMGETWTKQFEIGAPTQQPRELGEDRNPAQPPERGF